MRKTILLVFFCSIYWLSYSQENKDLIMYKADYFYCTLSNDKNEIVSEIPIGKELTVFYDKFFKKYDIWYYDENGAYKAIELKYIQDDVNGFIRVKSTFQKIHTYLLRDKLDINGELVYIGEELLKGYIVTYYIKNAVKIDTSKLKD